MRRALAVARKETLLLLRDPQFLVVQFVSPLILLVVFGLLFSASVRRVPITIRDLDGTSSSERMVRELTAGDSFAGATGNKEAGQALDSGESLTEVEIRPGFARRVRRAQRPDLQIIIDGTDPVAARAVQGYLEQFETFATSELKRSGQSGQDSIRAPLLVSTATWFNPEQDDALFFVPGVLGIILCCAPSILSALALVREREAGTFAALAVTPIRDGELLAGKLLPYFFHACLTAAALFALGFTLFALPLRGSPLLLVGASAAFVLSSVGIGAIISTLGRDQDSAWQLLCILVCIPAMIFSGAVYPISSMPLGARMIASVFPVRFYVQILRGVLLKGSGPAALAPELLALGSCCLVTLLFAGLLLRRERRHGA